MPLRLHSWAETRADTVVIVRAAQRKWQVGPGWVSKQRERKREKERRAEIQGVEEEIMRDAIPAGARGQKEKGKKKAPPASSRSKF